MGFLERGNEIQIQYTEVHVCLLRKQAKQSPIVREQSPFSVKKRKNAIRFLFFPFYILFSRIISISVLFIKAFAHAIHELPPFRPVVYSFSPVVSMMLTESIWKKRRLFPIFICPEMPSSIL